jgi:hypothetical protein
MLRLVLIITLFTLAGCYRPAETTSPTKQTEPPTVSLAIQITEPEIHSAIQEALSAVPLISNPQVTLQAGKIIVSGEDHSLTLVVTVQSTAFDVKATNITGLPADDARIAEFSQRVKEHLTTHAVRTIIWTN